MIETYSIKTDLSIVNARWLLDTITAETPSNYLYTFIGHPTAWSVETEPPFPVDDVHDFIDEWKGMLALKRVQPTDITLGIRKIVWTAGTVYTMYDDQDSDLHDKDYYVLTSQNRVYKCLNNNYNTPSTDEPDSTALIPFGTPNDGYRWQLMFDISSTDMEKWSDDTTIPVKILTEDDGSTQWQVQSAAVPGAIDCILLEEHGSGYLSAPTVSITGDGTGASATAILDGDSVGYITINSRGQGYTHAEVTLTGNATARAIISPVKGHGADAVDELGGRYLMIYSQFDKDENGTFPVDITFRQIGLVLNPTVHNTGAVAVDSAGINQMAAMEISSDPSNFIKGEQILNQTNNSTATFVSYNGNTVNLANINGTFQTGDSIIGMSSSISSTVISFTDSYLNLYSGNLLYVENREPVTRLVTQTETYKLVIAF